MISMTHHVQLEHAQLNNMTQYIEQLIEAKIIPRILSMRRFLKHLNVDPFDIYDQYVGQVFDQDIPKQIVFREFLLTDKIESDVIRMIGDLCSSQQLNAFRDNRKPEEYAANLVLGWILEDSIAIAAAGENIGVRLSGSDSRRQFLTANSISGTHDLEIINSHGPSKVEIVCDYTNWWANNPCDLRHNKVQKLNGSWLCGISLQGPNYFLLKVDLKDPRNLSYVDNHEKWNKPAWQITNVKSLLRPIDSLVVDLAAIGSIAT